MMTFGRTDRSVVSDWWWTVDRWLMVALFVLAGTGAILVMAASPPVADRIGVDTFHFVRRQIVFMIPALMVLVGVSMMSPLWVRRSAVIVFFGAVVLLFATLVMGAEIKGATRWLNVAGFVIQPSEFTKPALAVVVAWMLSQRQNDPGFPAFTVGLALLLLVLTPLLLQPDIGMALVVCAVWFIQMFLAGLPLFIVAGLTVVGMAGAVGAYAFFPHVASRIDRFLDPSSGDSFQVTTSLNAFGHGGLWGTGPGEGVVKQILPDAHADFIFAVAGEEFGLVFALFIVALFAFIVLRGLSRLMRETDLFILLAGTGLFAQVGLQSVINMGVNVSLLPAKGMTLPFISYGGSSTLALALGFGYALALTRARATPAWAGAAPTATRTPLNAVLRGAR